MPAPWLRAYPPETVIAEKLHAIFVLGETNSRMKDFFDLWVMAGHSVFTLETLTHAIRATFERRETALPAQPPMLLTEHFGPTAVSYRLWNAFIRKNGLEAIAFEEVQRVICAFASIPLNAALTRPALSLHWQPSELRWREMR